jgi:hypothetical protein
MSNSRGADRLDKSLIRLRAKMLEQQATQDSSEPFRPNLESEPPEALLQHSLLGQIFIRFRQRWDSFRRA